MTRTTLPSMAFFSPRAVSAVLPPTPPPKDLVTTTLFVTNLHCASCVAQTKDTVGPLPGIFDVQVNLVGHTICVRHESGLTSKIANVLIDAAFEVRHVTTSDSSGRVIGTHDVSNRIEEFRNHSRFPLFPTKARRKHITNCEACQSKSWSPRWLFGKSATSSEPISEFTNDDPSKLEAVTTSPTTTIDDEKPRLSQPIAPKPAIFIATISIEGMTCASCTSSITNELGNIDYIDDVQVNLLANNAKVTFRGLKSDAQKVADAIEEVGFDASVDHVVPQDVEDHTAKSSKAVISIEGMTCGSCVAAVTEGLKQVSGITSVNVDLMGNCATVHFTDETSVEKIIEAVEDLGFDASCGEIQTDAVESSKEITSRTVEFEITGMYCSMCPGKILRKITESYGDQVRIVTKPTLKQPRMTVEYEPAPPTLNVRSLKYTIESADPAIIASIYHPPSIEERSIAVQRKESTRILRHLIFTLIAAIPSFVIGIVYMNLVPESNPTRAWLEQPMWAGDAMRMDWAMFFITTPVMFYGAGIFHVRALKEIWSLWRPKSKVPVLRRLYRFGSMNLLISAGASVAYFSSLAILIMEAVSQPRTDSNNMTSPRRSITYFDTVTFLTLFLLCGKFLQAYSKSRTGDAVAMLGKLRPSEALLVDHHLKSWEEGIKPQLRSIPVDLLEIGDTVSIPHGASPPTDGIVDQDGTFLFDESSLTGESKPVRKIRGDTILTGSVNVSDPVRITVRELGGKSMLDKIIAVVRDGQAKRAPVERFADLITSYFTPVITLIAITTWVVWLGLGQSGVLPQKWLDVDQGGWPFWSVEFAIAVFVVACPCGLGLAAPTALFVGGGLAAKAGILVQGGGEAFQEASHLNAIVFDKTGTLTEGQMRVTDMEMLDQQSQKEKFDLTLHLAKALEDSSTHPIAKAIAKFCEESKSPNNRLSVSDVGIKEIPGQGMTGVFEVLSPGSEKPLKYEAAIGNERLLTTLGIQASDSSTQPQDRSGSVNTYLAASLGRFQASGCSTAIFALRQLSPSTAGTSTSPFTPLAVFAITDPIRPEAFNVLRTLRDQKISIHMCTGDNAVTARAIASQLDIPVSNIRAGVLPQDKAAYITELQSPPDNASGTRRIIAFVGDGTNDTPALTAADVSIALSSGSDVAITTASFILLNSDLGTILHLVGLAKRVFLRVKLNFAWAAIYNVCLIPVAAGVFFPIAQWRLSPVWAAAAMAGSSVSVVLSSLALKLPEMKLWKR